MYIVLDNFGLVTLRTSELFPLKTPSLRGGGLLPPPKNPTPLSALIFGPSVLTNEKSWAHPCTSVCSPIRTALAYHMQRGDDGTLAE